ncbi:CoA transferase [Rhodoblastus sphagnicola]|uniref:CoA transferase n=1 Tax=Rhodoblastus sphagnicola TaxID=333368 RepID=A0A2S6ND87_9HYPH|nr:CaiB/BaiF CoA-transferase family protein [Rhodoblastus sphagnicola]MBB4197984.1 crotonobetainyl-CoA:carnitine CoA-transferase CaiB-like acyl-CoA transferase [Rhodoblastus sphagnicola]PPQ32578.1 CoA transferase [Rhodoblastus sphagnicola]
MTALSHLRVLDLSRILAGPWASQFLGDLGAEVFKIEHPKGGDDTRAWGPPYAKTADGEDSDVAAYFLAANRNKKSVALDIATPEGQDIIRKMVACCDVLIENFKVGGLAKYGLDYASLSAVNPRIVYCSITGFGQTGPYAKRPGYDFLIQGLGGLMSLTGHPDGAAGGGPMKVGVALTDVMTGLYASNAILAALAWREVSGQGQHIDLALLDVQVACLANRALNELVGSPGQARFGNAHPSIVPYQDFPTADGHMILAVGNDGQFARFCQEAGEPALASESRFATNAARVANRVELVEKLRALTVARTTKDWIAALEQAGVPCGPINGLGEVFADPQVQARDMAREMEHDRLGCVPTVANPIRMSKTPATYRSAPPELGAHTRDVLAGLKIVSDAEMDDLEARGVIGRGRAD